MFIKYRSNKIFEEALSTNVPILDFEKISRVYPNIKKGTKVIRENDVVGNKGEITVSYNPDDDSVVVYGLRVEESVMFAMWEFETVSIKTNGQQMDYVLYDMIFMSLGQKKYTTNTSNVSDVKRLQGALLPTLGQALLEDGVWKVVESDTVREDTILSPIKHLSGTKVSIGFESLYYISQNQLEHVISCFGKDRGTIYNTFINKDKKSNKIIFTSKMTSPRFEKGVNCLDTPYSLVLDQNGEGLVDNSLNVYHKRHFFSNSIEVSAVEKQKTYPKVDKIEDLIEKYQLQESLKLNIIYEGEERINIVSKHKDVILLRHYARVSQESTDQKKLIYFAIYKDGKVYDARNIFKKYFTHKKAGTTHVWNTKVVYENFIPSDIQEWGYVIPTLDVDLDTGKALKILLETSIAPELELYLKSPLAFLFEGVSATDNKMTSIIEDHIGIINSEQKKTFNKLGITYKQLELIYNGSLYAKTYNFPLVVKHAINQKRTLDIRGVYSDRYWYHALKSPGFIDITSIDDETIVSTVNALDSMAREILRHSHDPRNISTAIKILPLAFKLNKTWEDNIKTIEFIEQIATGEIYFEGYGITEVLSYRLMHYIDYIESLAGARFKESIYEELDQIGDDIDELEVQNLREELSKTLELSKNYKAYASSGELLEDRIQIVSSVSNLASSIEFSRKIKSRKKVWEELVYENDEFVLIAPKSSNDLYREGFELNHCVAGYTNSVAAGKTNIFFIRRKSQPDTPYYTIEVDNRGSIIQVRGLSNCSPTREVSNFVQDYRQSVLKAYKKSL